MTDGSGTMRCTRQAWFLAAVAARAPAKPPGPDPVRVPVIPIPGLEQNDRYLLYLLAAAILAMAPMIRRRRGRCAA